jgi:hypothetical protein
MLDAKFRFKVDKKQGRMGTHLAISPPLSQRAQTKSTLE